MPTRQLTADELKNLAYPLLTLVRKQLQTRCRGDEALLWALRRKVAKELSYDERSKPAQRGKLKRQKRKEQSEVCALCPAPLPARGAILDRLEPMLGYTPENTRLLCPQCDTRVQEQRGYK